MCVKWFQPIERDLNQNIKKMNIEQQNNNDNINTNIHIVW